MRTRACAILFLLFAVVNFGGDNATAWGPITHMTILDDILHAQGLDPGVKKILQDNLKYAKGGVTGPDMFYFNNKRYSDIAHYCRPGDLAKKCWKWPKKMETRRRLHSPMAG